MDCDIILGETENDESITVYPRMCKTDQGCGMFPIANRNPRSGLSCSGGDTLVVQNELEPTCGGLSFQSGNFHNNGRNCKMDIVCPWAPIGEIRYEKFKIRRGYCFGCGSGWGRGYPSVRELGRKYTFHIAVSR